MSAGTAGPAECTPTSVTDYSDLTPAYPASSVVSDVHGGSQSYLASSDRGYLAN